MSIVAKMHLFLVVGCCFLLACPATGERMDTLWGDQKVIRHDDSAEKWHLFDKKYAMFIHWGLYSNLAGKFEGKTYYGIGEWIMSPRMADIPVEKYKNLADGFNPVNFDAKAIAQLAKDAGMKYVVITSKHHDGFAMYHSKASKFNVVDATLAIKDPPMRELANDQRLRRHRRPRQMAIKDPMRELADACRNLGLGFGFYYSHYQDWTYPGGARGPKKHADGRSASFDDYFYGKCLPQVEEITTQYGYLDFVWFDTPGAMEKHYIQQLVDIVRKHQPKALMSTRVGAGLGDYKSLGDMAVPVKNTPGKWETVDTTNDSWSYAWYDENWKTPEELLGRLLSCVARGGTYMLNIGPRGDGSIPERAARLLRVAGKWIHRYPQTVYGASSSPWGHALPWGDATVQGNRIFLLVTDWPRSGRLLVPGLKNEIRLVRLLREEGDLPLIYKKKAGNLWLEVPTVAPEKLISVIELELDGVPVADTVHTLDSEFETTIEVDFGTVVDATVEEYRWMEKFGEWKHVMQATDWDEEGKVIWEVNVPEPGDYAVKLTYAGDGRLVWKVGIEGGPFIQNEQRVSDIYRKVSIGWLHFAKAGRHKVFVSSEEGGHRGAGNREKAKLTAIHFKPLRL